MWVLISIGNSFVVSLTCISGLKLIISGDGVWRIRRKDKSPVIEVFKHGELGQGDILSREFIEWRSRKMDGGDLDISGADVAANISA